jgi:hexosaminidase
VEVAAAARIVAQDPALAPLARVLAGEIYFSTAVRLPTAGGAAGQGDIALGLGPAIQADEGYRLAAGPAGIAVEARTYRGAAWGAATLIQAIEAAGGRLRVPRMTVEDEPVARYRGLLVDVARQWHPVETLRPLIEMCRLYKINYVQLHLNDQQSFTFPSRAFPELHPAAKGQRRTYTWEELKDLVRFADERGVTLVPELEGPGHHSGALRTIWGRKGTSCLDMAGDKTYEGLDTLIGEICDVFASSPYVHIGADECDLKNVGTSDEEKAFMAAHGLQGAVGLYNYYIVRAAGIVRKHGRQAICWEGFQGDGGAGVKIPKDILVMPFESTYNPADRLAARGYTVINAAWKPLYVVGARKWPAQYIYENWNLWLWEHHINTQTHIQLKRTAPVLGAQMCAWEQPAEVELPSLRERLHAVAERIWNPDAGRTFADFAARASGADRLLDRLLGLVDVRTDGLPGGQRGGFFYFWDPIAVRLAAPAIGTIRYTLDGKDPAADSPAYAGPITLTKESTHPEKLFYERRTGKHLAQGDVVRVKARIFDPAGKPLGDCVTVGQYWHKDPAELAKEEAAAKN